MGHWPHNPNHPQGYNMTNITTLLGGPHGASRLLPFVPDTVVSDPAPTMDPVTALGGPHGASRLLPHVSALGVTSSTVSETTDAADSPETLFPPLSEKDLRNLGDDPRDSLSFSPRVNSRQTVTAQFLAVHWGTLRPMLVEYLHRKLPQTRTLGTAEDHVGGFAAKILASDYLASYINAGEKVRACVFKHWVWHFACSEMRGWGTDASLRETRGATTVSDRRGNTRPSRFTTAKVVRQYEDGTEVGSDITDSACRSPEDSMVSTESLDRCDSALSRAFRPDVALLYQRLLRLEVEDTPRKDMASILGVDEPKVARMLLQMRGVLRTVVAAS